MEETDGPSAPPTEEEESGNQVDWTARWDVAPIFKIEPQATATISLDFRDVPAGFQYNEHYAIIILGKAEEAPISTNELEREQW